MADADPAPSLFLVVLGGRASGCHIEQHDVRFVAGTTIDDTLPALRSQWRGLRRGAHIDSFMAVRAIDGWCVSLVPAAAQPLAPEPERPERLWFVNLGAYRPDALAELHHFGLVVATSPQAAKAAARRRWLLQAEQQHKDDLHGLDLLADDVLPLAGCGSWRVRLTPHPQGWSQPQVPDWFGYRLLQPA